MNQSATPTRRRTGFRIGATLVGLGWLILLGSGLSYGIWVSWPAWLNLAGATGMLIALSVWPERPRLSITLIWCAAACSLIAATTMVVAH